MDAALDKTNVSVDWTTGRVYASVSRKDTSPDQILLRYADAACSSWSPTVAVGNGWPSGLQVGYGDMLVADAALDEDALLTDPVQVYVSFDRGLSFSSLSSPGLMAGDDLLLTCAGCAEGDDGCGLLAETPPRPVLYASSWPGVAASWFRTGPDSDYRHVLVSAMARSDFSLAFRYIVRACNPTCSWTSWSAESSLAGGSDLYASPAVDVVENDVQGARFQTFATWYAKSASGDAYDVFVNLGTLPQPPDTGGAITWGASHMLTSVASNLAETQREANIRHMGHHRFSRGGRGLHTHPIWIDTRDSLGVNLATTYTTFITPVLW